MELRDQDSAPVNIIRRKRRMEGVGGGGGQGEVRRVNIIYFLSRMGRIEHPHLIRIHHLTRNGIYLRDVKRWLAEVRGHDMPEAFSWSYKRTYKNGHVWQDLLDGDLITPVSDNEYVLKGSQYGDGCHHEKKTSEAVDEHRRDKEEIVDPNAGIPLSEIDQDSPLFNGSDTSTLTDHSTKNRLEEKEHTSKQTTSEQNGYNPSICSNPLNKNKCNNNKTKDGNHNIKDTATSDSSFSSSSSSYMSLKSSQSQPFASKSKATNMFRNWIRCGAVDTNDAVLVTVNQADHKTTTPSTHHDKSITNLPACRASIYHHGHGDTQGLGGSCRVFGTPWNDQQQHHHQQQYYNARRSFDGVRSSKKKQYEFGSPKPASSVYKPAGGPTCSQCGKSFKPEKLHAHMKSCKGMKALAKPASLSLRKTPSQRSSNSPHEDSISAYFLPN